MQNLIDDIRERLDGMNTFKYIDEDWGQLDDYSPNPPTKFPTVLVDVAEVRPSETSSKIQLVDITVMVKVASIKLSPGSQRASATQQANAKKPLGITIDIHKQLHGWHKANSSYGTLTRVGMRRNHRDDGIREFQLLFKTTLKDTSAHLATIDLSDQVPEIIKPKVTILKA